jgi:hypothetical protein
MATSRSCVFLTADEARNSPLRDRAVHDEARGIESVILDAVKLGLFEATVSNNTPMTNSAALFNQVWTIDPLTDQLYIPNHNFSTGDTITLSSTVALPAPLKSNAYYYAIYVDPDHIKLAASYADALSGRPVPIDVTSGLTAITITEQGSGYIQPPLVTISGGNPTVSATARAYLASWGSVVAIANTTGGAGYSDQPTVQIVAQGSGATIDTVRYTAVGISINNSGMDYHLGDIITVVGGTGVAATALVSGVNANGEIQSLVLSNPGNYTVIPGLVGATTTVLPGGGTGATVNLTMGIKEISISSAGLGYTAPPRVVIQDPSGVGAEAVAMVTGGAVTSVLITNTGYGYVGVTSVTFDSGNGATAIASMTPSSVNSIEIVENDYYVSVPSVTITAVGSGAAAGTVSMKVVSVQMTSSGINYSKDDYLLIAGGVATENSYIRVTAVDTQGRIQSYSLESGGSYTALPGLESNPVNGGSGTLAAFNLVMGVNDVGVLTAGSGYSVPPVVAVEPPLTGGTAAVVSAVLSSGNVSTFDVLVPGTLYTSIPNVTVSNGSGATASAILSPTSLFSINMISTGSGYSYATVTITGGGASVNATATANIVGDQITSIDVITPGSGYTNLPIITIAGDGIDADAVGELASTTLQSISVLTNGSGYNVPPAVTIDGDALAVSVLAATTIDRIVVIDQGVNYTADPTVYLIPGPYQIGTPVPPVTIPQRGYSIANIAVTSGGDGYETTPNITLAPPQITGGIQSTATASIGAGVGTFGIRLYPDSRDYFKAWKNQELSNNQLSRPYIDRMDTIITYFTNLGYQINRLTNPSTNATIMWKILW